MYHEPCSECGQKEAKRRKMEELRNRTYPIEKYFHEQSDDPRGVRIKKIENYDKNVWIRGNCSPGGLVVNLRESKYIDVSKYLRVCKSSQYTIDGRKFVVHEEDKFRGREVRHSNFKCFDFKNENMPSYESYSNVYENCTFNGCNLLKMTSKNDRFLNCLFIDCFFGYSECPSIFENVIFNGTQIREMRGVIRFAGIKNDLIGLTIDRYSRKAGWNTLTNAESAKVYDEEPMAETSTI